MYTYTYIHTIQYTNTLFSIHSLYEYCHTYVPHITTTQYYTTVLLLYGAPFIDYRTLLKEYRGFFDRIWGSFETIQGSFETIQGSFDDLYPQRIGTNSGGEETLVFHITSQQHSIALLYYCYMGHFS